MSAAAKDVSALPTGKIPAFDAVAGPAMAAMVLPTAMMMGGFVAMCGVGFAFARAFTATGREETEAAPSSVIAPRLVVSNPPPPVVAAPAAAEAAKPALAKPTVTLPKPKAAKVAAVKAPVEAAKPAPAKPTGTGSTPPKSGATAPKTKSPAVSKTEAAAVAPAAKKPVPKAATAPTIAKTSTAKGISLPKVSIQKTPGSEPGKD